jgi:hypothetical protein
MNIWDHRSMSIGGLLLLIGDRTCLHSGHSKCFNCSQAAFVKPMHFGWYLHSHIAGSLMSSTSGEHCICFAQGPLTTPHTGCTSP